MAEELITSVPYTIPVKHFKDGQNEPEQVTQEKITITVNFDALARMLGTDVVRSQTGELKKLYGAVVIRRVKS